MGNSFTLRYKSTPFALYLCSRRWEHVSTFRLLNTLRYSRFVLETDEQDLTPSSCDLTDPNDDNMLRILQASSQETSFFSTTTCGGYEAVTALGKSWPAPRLGQWPESRSLTESTPPMPPLSALHLSSHHLFFPNVITGGVAAWFGTEQFCFLCLSCCHVRYDTISEVYCAKAFPMGSSSSVFACRAAVSEDVPRLSFASM